MRLLAEQNEKREHMNLVEAALFVSGKAMSIEEIANAVGIASIGYVRKTVEELVNEYNNRNTSIQLIRLGDKYILSVKEQYATKVSSVAGQPDLSKGALRVLAYVSKNEPIMQNNVVKSFGTSVYDYVKELVENDFIRTSRIGRTKRLETTQKFKEYFNF